MLMGAGICFFLLLAAFQSRTVRAAWQAFIELRGKPMSASPAVLSEHEIAALAGAPAQQQAERLLERAVNHYSGAIELIDEKVSAWRGSLSFTPQFNTIIVAALNSNDLRVRAAALEVQLAAYNIEKTPEAVNRLIGAIEQDPGNRAVNLWMLALLGSRGVEAERVHATLLAYVHDPQEEVRHWAVEGLGHLGTDDTIAPLLEVFRNDPSAVVRELAGCSLASSGMLTQQQRVKAVPELLTYMDDPALDSLTRTWVFQALRDITGQPIRDDAAAWRHWYSMRSLVSPSGK